MVIENEAIDKRHLRSVITREKLLEAAKEVFVKEGYQKTTISQIIKKAKVGYGTAYVHFEGKDDILIVLMEDVMQQFYQIAETPFFPQTKEEAEEIIQTQAYSFLKLAEKERPMMRVFHQAIGFSTAVSNNWRKIQTKFIQGISKDIAYSQQSGIAGKGLNHEIVARAWFYTNEMYLWEIVRDENLATVEEISKTITSIYTSGLYK
ncbi:TetR/AcrR family transcriptional regulator [Cytobacillus depressus]|uniref:TetR/AcrR family transcriptional regulator n=1 Tax=Cytobacillus depressus TaxID=1602942 RepID=A0A6L3VBG3_9BACI|nr:TetR/AcrR family transcriptional regulator [Cytobacillus depressus]KAB2337060.1 TetR/AcrR family transcriptional regulator [Cytobacillus depressus]